MDIKILLLGAPGAGKGTQAKELKSWLKVPIISMGDMLRDIVKTDREMREKIIPYMDAGELVPDLIVGEVLKVRLQRKDCENGFILDGFPRSLVQAELLDRIGVKIDKAVEISVSDEEIIKRLSGRIICEDCGEIFHLENKKPVNEGVCDVCGGELKVRKDDEFETIVKRLKVFHEEMEPLRRYYFEKGKFFKIDGEMQQEEVTKDLLRVVEGEKND